MKKLQCIDIKAFSSGHTVSGGVGSYGYLAMELLSSSVHESVFKKLSQQILEISFLVFSRSPQVLKLSVA